MALSLFKGLKEAQSTGSAARFLGVSDSYVRRLVRDGRLASIPTPLGRLIPKESLEDFARRRDQSVRPQVGAR
jgi:excisionase family DNA binding protein